MIKLEYFREQRGAEKEQRRSRDGAGRSREEQRRSREGAGR